MIRTCECVKGLKRDSSRNEGRNWWKIRGGRGVSEWRVTWRSAGHRAAGIEATSHRDTRIRSERGWSNYEDWPVTDQSDPTGDPGTSSACLSFFRAFFRKSCSFRALLIEAQYSLSLSLFLARARANVPIHRFSPWYNFIRSKDGTQAANRTEFDESAAITLAFATVSSFLGVVNLLFFWCYNSRIWSIYYSIFNRANLWSIYLLVEM